MNNTNILTSKEIELLNNYNILKKKGGGLKKQPVIVPNNPQIKECAVAYNKLLTIYNKPLLVGMASKTYHKCYVFQPYQMRGTNHYETIYFIKNKNIIEFFVMDDYSNIYLIGCKDYQTNNEKFFETPQYFQEMLKSIPEWYFTFLQENKTGIDFNKWHEDYFIDVYDKNNEQKMYYVDVLPNGYTLPEKQPTKKSIELANIIYDIVYKGVNLTGILGSYYHRQVNISQNIEDFSRTNELYAIWLSNTAIKNNWYYDKNNLPYFLISLYIYSQIHIRLQYNKKEDEFIHEFCKIYNIVKKIHKTTIKNNFSGLYNFSTFLRQILDEFVLNTITNNNEIVDNLVNLLSRVDDNRDLIYNYFLIKDYVENKQSEKIKKQQISLYNILEDVVIDDYIVKVPLTIQDLQNEGSQQNNCVGSYYNNDIIEGTNKIYFIRKKENPTKSFITCRIQKFYEENEWITVESRLKNNNNIKNEHSSIIKQIDKIINNKILQD